MKCSYIVLPIVVLVFCCACTPTTTITQVEAFSSSIESLTTSTDELLTEYNSSTIEARLAALRGQHVLVGEGDDTSKNNLSVDELSEIVNVFDLDTKKKLSIYKANNALRRYSQGIGQLMAAPNSQSISTASATLVNALKAMEESYQGLKGDESIILLKPDTLGSVGAVISSIGGAIVDETRKNALKDIIVKSDPVITTLVNEITSVIDSAEIADDLRVNAELTLAAKIANYNARVDQGVYRINQTQQALDLRALWDEYQSVLTTETRVRHLRDSIAAVSKQHAVIAKEVSANRFSSQQIMESVAIIKAMENRYKTFKDSVINCNKLKVDDSGRATCDE